MKQFVKALEKDGDCFNYICMKFPGLTIKKLKVAIYDGPQIQMLINDANFCNFMNPAELNAAMAFTNTKFFLETKKALNYKELVETLLTSLHQTGANASIKLYFLNNYFLRFRENLGDVSDEQG